MVLYVQVSHVRTVNDRMPMVNNMFQCHVEMTNNMKSDKAREERLRRSREYDRLQRERKPMKPRLQSSKVGVLVSPCCHVCNNACVPSIVFIIVQQLPFF